MLKIHFIVYTKILQLSHSYAYITHNLKHPLNMRNPTLHALSKRSVRLEVLGRPDEAPAFIVRQLRA